MTNKPIIEKLVYWVMALLIAITLVFLAVTPEKFLETKPVYGAF